MSTRMFRYVTIALFFSSQISIAACSRKNEMCARCHMALTPGDLHNTEIVYTNGTGAKFDSAICAITIWQHAPQGSVPKSMTVHEYYDGALRDATEVLFVRGTDVTGPMGDDFIAIDPNNLKKFQTDHGGKSFKLAEIKLDSP